MSRLDDELRKAFQREQPSADFAARVLERVAQRPAPRARWWERLAALLSPPKLRWVAIGVTASLLLAIGAAQYQKLNQSVVTDDGKTAVTLPPPASVSPESTVPMPAQPREETATLAPKKPYILRPARSSSTNRRRVAPRIEQETVLRAEGEAAKESLMLALSIASSALSEAQKAVNNDGLKP
jgi:hypothetical protein